MNVHPARQRLQKNYPPEEFDCISSAEDNSRSRKRKKKTDSCSDKAKKHKKTKSGKKSRKRKKKESSSDSSSSDSSSDSETCIAGRAAAKKIQNGSDSILSNPDWVFQQLPDLTATRERLSTDIHVRIYLLLVN